METKKKGFIYESYVNEDGQREALIKGIVKFKKPKELVFVPHESLPVEEDNRRFGFCRIAGVAPDAFSDEKANAMVTKVTIPETMVGTALTTETVSMIMKRFPGRVCILARTKCDSEPYTAVVDSISMTCELEDYTGKRKKKIREITVPERTTINGFEYTVKSIGSKCFSSARHLEKIVIPSSVESIHSEAFRNCKSLTAIELPEKLNEIETNVFLDCKSLESIVIPEGVTSIGWGAFYRCNSLQNVTLPESLKSIGEHSFLQCISLKDITLPSNVTKIDNYAFADCRSLERLSLPDGMTEIKGGVFWHCINLSNINLPDGITSIGRYAFCGCSSLKSVTLPESITTLTDDVFQECTNLLEIRIPGTDKAFPLWMCLMDTDLKDITQVI